MSGYVPGMVYGTGGNRLTPFDPDPLTVTPEPVRRRPDPETGCGVAIVVALIAAALAIGMLLGVAVGGRG